MARLYCFFGQSNSRGAAPNGDIGAGLGAAMPNVQMWEGTTFAAFDVGVNQNYPNKDGFHGCLPAFLKSEQSRVGETIYALNYSVGATQLNANGAEQDWSTASVGELTDKSISTMNNAIAYMWNTLSIRTIDVYIIWQQGESDTVLDADANAYQTNLTNLVAKFNSNLSGLAFTNSKKKWIFVKISTDTTYDATRRGTVNSAMAAVAALDSMNRFTFDPTGALLQADQHHYEASGYQTYGENMVTNIMAANNL